MSSPLLGTLSPKRYDLSSAFGEILVRVCMEKTLGQSRRSIFTDSAYMIHGWAYGTRGSGSKTSRFEMLWLCFPFEKASRAGDLLDGGLGDGDRVSDVCRIESAAHDNADRRVEEIQLRE